MGCYLHGLLAADGFRAAFLAGLGRGRRRSHDGTVEAALDALAAHLGRHLDVDALLALSAPAGALTRMVPPPGGGDRRSVLADAFQDPVQLDPRELLTPAGAFLTAL